jgi:hypothetical protein
MNRLDKTWMPSCAMKRVITHWTGGGHKANSLDRAHYHVLIEGDGTLVRGTHSIQDNVSTAGGRYAAHTRGCNTGSIGVSLCCMLNAQRSPFKAGPHPMTEKQFHVMAEVVADLCQFYKIPVGPRTVLGHGEVQANLGIGQSGKWDPLALPWAPEMSLSQAGAYFRTLVTNVLEGVTDTEEEPPAVSLMFRGEAAGEAMMINEGTFVKIRPLADRLGWKISEAARGEVCLEVGGKEIVLPYKLVAGSGFVSCRGLAVELGLPIEWDGASRRVTIGSASE